MPDPLQALPIELWIECMEFAIDGRAAGPLDFIMVSQDWAAVLLSSPSLWTQIYIQNGEDEIARISTFLHLSKQCQLHVDVMTVLPNVDSLRLVAEHISRVRTISIRPGPSDTFIASHAKQWNRAAAYVLEILSNLTPLCDVKSPGCFGVTLSVDEQRYYHVIVMQFTVTARVAAVDGPDHKWEDHIENERIIPDPGNENKQARAASISSIAVLAPQARFNDAIRVAIPSLIKSLEIEEANVQLRTFDLIDMLANLDAGFRKAITSSLPSLTKMFHHENKSVRSAIAELISKLVNHVEFREAVARRIPSLNTLLGDRDLSAQRRMAELVGNLAKHVEFHEAVKRTIPSLKKLFDDKRILVRLLGVDLIGKLAYHAEFREAVKFTIPLLIKLLEDEFAGAHIAGIIGKLANHLEFRETIASLVSSFIGWLEDEDMHVRLHGVTLIGELTNHVEFREVIASTIPSLNVLLSDEDEDLRLKTAELIGKLASHAEFREAITHVMPPNSHSVHPLEAAPPNPSQLS